VFMYIKSDERICERLTASPPIPGLPSLAQEPLYRVRWDMGGTLSADDRAWAHECARRWKVIAEVSHDGGRTWRRDDGC